MDNWSKAVESFQAIPKVIQGVIFYRTFFAMDNKVPDDKKQDMCADCPEFGRYSYLKYKELKPEYHLET